MRVIATLPYNVAKPVDLRKMRFRTLSIIRAAVAYNNGVGRMGKVQPPPECRGPLVPGKKTKGVYGRLVHVGKTFNRFADFGL